MPAGQKIYTARSNTPLANDGFSVSLRHKENCLSDHVTTKLHEIKPSRKMKGEFDQGKKSDLINGGMTDGAFSESPAIQSKVKRRRGPYLSAWESVNAVQQFTESLSISQIGEVLQLLSSYSAGKTAILNAAKDIGKAALALPQVDVADAVDLDELLPHAGDLLTSLDVAVLIAQSQQSINQQARNGRLLGLRFGSRWRFPSIQFVNREAVPGLSSVLRAVGHLDPWQTLSILIMPRNSPSKQPLTLLKNGDRYAAIEVAKKLAGQLRHRNFSQDVVGL